MLSLDVFPVAGDATYSDDFNPSPNASGNATHAGIDIFAAEGTPVVAVADGHVRQVANEGIGGNVVYLTTPPPMTTYFYAHLSSFEPVDPSGNVTAGEVIGYVGHTGNAQGTSSHTHFEVHPSASTGEPSLVDPFPLLQAAQESGTTSPAPPVTTPPSSTPSSTPSSSTTCPPSGANPGLTPAFFEELAAMGQRHHTDPEIWLVAWAVESGLNPAIISRVQPCAQGLNQMIPATLAGLGAPSNYYELAGEAQLPWIERLISGGEHQIGGPFTSAGLYYWSNFFPKTIARGIGGDPGAVVAAKDAHDGAEAAAYANNTGLDADHSGAITLADLETFLAKIRGASWYQGAVAKLRAAQVALGIPTSPPYVSDAIAGKALLVAYAAKYPNAGASEASDAVRWPLAQAFDANTTSAYDRGTNNLGRLAATQTFEDAHGTTRGYGLAARLLGGAAGVYLAPIAIYPSLLAGAAALLEHVETAIGPLADIATESQYAAALYAAELVDGSHAPATPPAGRAQAAQDAAWTPADEANIDDYATALEQQQTRVEAALAAAWTAPGDPGDLAPSPPSVAPLLERLTPSDSLAPHTRAHALELLGAAATTAPPGGLTLAQVDAAPNGDGVWLYGGASSSTSSSSTSAADTRTAVAAGFFIAAGLLTAGTVAAITYARHQERRTA